jgi:hypothetical protein
MPRTIQSTHGATGYRHQLDRARRFLDRAERSFEDLSEMDEVEFQDMMWSFFQHCWHVKDWVRHDPLATDIQKNAVIRTVEQSTTLGMCRDLCNGTKHLKLHPRSGPTAQHRHIETTIAPERGHLEIDCILDDGAGNLISGKQLARDCITEWERILESEGLATARLS